MNDDYDLTMNNDQPENGSRWLFYTVISTVLLGAILAGVVAGRGLYYNLQQDIRVVEGGAK